MVKIVEGFGSHPIPEFTYVGDEDVFGVLHVGLVHDSGSKVVMPAAAMLSVGERPLIAQVVAEVASFAADHAGYHQVDRIAQLPDRAVLKRAEVDEVRAVYRRASLYATSTGLIIKAFDKAPNREAVAQFAVMTGLHQSFLRSPEKELVPLRAPEHFAVIQPPVGKHRTIIMETVEGRRLYDVLGELPEVEEHGLVARQELSRLIKPVLEDAVAAQVDEKLLPYVNDITGGAEGGLYTNLIVPISQLASAPATAEDVSAMIKGGAIIDQPRFLPEIGALGWLAGMDKIAKLLNH